MVMDCDGLAFLLFSFMSRCIDRRVGMKAAAGTDISPESSSSVCVLFILLRSALVIGEAATTLAFDSACFFPVVADCSLAT